MLELGESMLVRSPKWEAIGVLQSSQWIEAGTDPKGVVALAAQRLSRILDRPNSRLALLGIYLIDIRQDILNIKDHEKLRDVLLFWLIDNVNAANLSIWGRNEDKSQTDLEIMKKQEWVVQEI